MRARQVIQGTVDAYINIVNLTELYYILHRYSPIEAEEKTRNLKAYGIKVIPLNDDRLWKLAAKIKSNHPMSIADSFAVATAQLTDSRLVIGNDQEFNTVPIETLRIGPE